MAETVTNRGATRLLAAALAGTALDLRMCAFTGTAVGVHDRTLNTVADLDAVTSVAIHAERLTLAGEAATEDDANNRGVASYTPAAEFAASPAVTAQGVAIYEEGASDAARNLIGVYTTGFPQPMDGGLTVSNPNGFLRANALTG
jgi:hypothetical protein